jgi:phage terminase large subunit-like protein
VGEVVFTFFGAEFGDQFSNLAAKGWNGSLSGLAQQRLEFAERLLDRIEIGRVFWHDVYTELLARITAIGGMLYITLTPLRGMSEIFLRYRKQFSPDRTFIQFGIEDTPRPMATSSPRIAPASSPVIPSMNAKSDQRANRCSVRARLIRHPKATSSRTLTR